MSEDQRDAATGPVAYVVMQYAPYEERTEPIAVYLDGARAERAVAENNLAYETEVAALSAARERRKARLDQMTAAALTLNKSGTVPRRPRRDVVAEAEREVGPPVPDGQLSHRWVEEAPLVAAGGPAD